MLRRLRMKYVRHLSYDLATKESAPTGPGVGTIRTLHIIGSKRSGGAERFFLRLTDALRNRNGELYTITSPVSSLNRSIPSAAGTLHVPMRSVWDWPSRWKISQIISDIKPDIVQTYMGRATRLTHVAQAAPSVHIARLGGYYNAKGYRHVHALVGNTRGICDYLLKQGFPPDRIFHIGNFVEHTAPLACDALQANKRAIGIPDGAFVLLGLGRFHDNKAFDDLLKAFAHVPKSVAERPVHLLLVGDGELAEPLKAQCRALGLEDRVHWPGWVDDTDLFYQCADVFVCPSRFEPLGNVILEAWSNGVPVVFTRSDGALELATHEDNALLVDCGAIQPLAALITHLLEAAPCERERLVRNGRRTLTVSHSEEAVVQSYQAMYESVLAQKPVKH